MLLALQCAPSYRPTDPRRHLVAHPILVRTGKALTPEGESLAEAIYPSLLEFAHNVPNVA